MCQTRHVLVVVVVVEIQFILRQNFSLFIRSRDQTRVHDIHKLAIYHFLLYFTVCIAVKQIANATRDGMK